jgi:hypothetical protein
VKKFAFAVGSEPYEEFEIFEITAIPDAFPKIQETWSQGILVGTPTLVRVLGVSGISSGDQYVDGQFVNKSESNSLELSDEIVAFALVSNSTVYGTLSMGATSFAAEKYIAAVQEKVIVLDVTDNPDVTLGAIWDGSKIITS